MKTQCKVCGKDIELPDSNGLSKRYQFKLASLVACNQCADRRKGKGKAVPVTSTFFDVLA